MSNAFSHSYQLDGLFPILGLLGGIFHFYSNLKSSICKRIRGEPDQTLRFAASGLVLHSLSMSHKKDTRLIWDNFKKRLSFCALLL